MTTAIKQCIAFALIFTVVFTVAPVTSADKSEYPKESARAEELLHIGNLRDPAFSPADAAQYIEIAPSS